MKKGMVVVGAMMTMTAARLGNISRIPLSKRSMNALKESETTSKHTSRCITMNKHRENDNANQVVNTNDL